MRYQTPFIVFKKKNQNMWFIKTLNNNHKYNHVMTNTDNVFDWKCYQKMNFVTKKIIGKFSE